MFKNVASQKVPVFAWDTIAGAPITGDAGNISAQISIDGAATAATDDVAPTELDATDAKGIYLFDMTQDETNGDLIILSAVSATADIDLQPVFIYPYQYLQPTTAGRTLDVNAAGEAGLDLDNTSGTWAAAQFAAAFLTASKFGAGALDAAALATDAVNEIRNAITGGAYALDTDANGAIRIVDGTGARELNTNSGAVALVDLCTSNSDMRGTDVADVLTQVNAGLDASISELAGVPSATPSIRDAIMFVFMGLRNKHDTTSVSDEIHNSAGAVIATAVLSDDTITYLKAKYA